MVVRFQVLPKDRKRGAGWPFNVNEGSFQDPPTDGLLLPASPIPISSPSSRGISVIVLLCLEVECKDLSLPASNRIKEGGDDPFFDPGTILGKEGQVNRDR